MVSYLQTLNDRASRIKDEEVARKEGTCVVRSSQVVPSRQLGSVRTSLQSSSSLSL